MAEDRQDNRGGGHGILSPLRRRLFRAVWIANLVSNFGWLIQGVGAAWQMTEMTGSAEMVALVQTATQLPVLLFALVAGAAADLWSRRTVLLVAQGWMFGVSLALAAMTHFGLVGPWLLLVFTFALGAGAALNGPALQAVVRELASGADLPAAVTLNAIGFNIARSLGPALGGAIVAAAGAEAAFLVNAVSYVALILVLVSWRRRPRPDDLPRERMLGAMIVGLRYVAQSAQIRGSMVHAAVFSLAATSSLALLPLVARDSLGGGPVVYGVLLGAFGAGALGGAFLIHPLRQRLGGETMVTVLGAVTGVSLLVIGLWPAFGPVLVALALSGAAWLGCFSSFNIAVQTSSAFWVQARVLAFYQMITAGALGLGAWAWGWVANRYGLPAALTGSGVMMLLGLLLHFRYHLPTGQGPDLRPLKRPALATPAIPFDPEEGPVLVTVEYRVAPADARAFVAAMDEVGHLRRRNGAVRWQLYQDVTEPERWVETYTLATWLEHLREHRRTTAFDEAIEAAARRFHAGGTEPLVCHMLARGPDSEVGAGLDRV
ncbi:MAG TPA: MFS transporter [Geminicoccaceae bacterium]|nr:MFS transporter [Geminicoccaceae bacterium]